MDSSIDELIKEVAIKNGVSITRDDPILITMTMNEKLIADNTKAQKEALHHLKEELELIMLRWENSAKEKSEKIINASLNASKDVMEKILHSSAETTAQMIKKQVDNSLFEAGKILLKSKQIATLNICASAITFFSVCAFLIVKIL